MDTSADLEEGEVPDLEEGEIESEESPTRGTRRSPRSSPRKRKHSPSPTRYRESDHRSRRRKRTPSPRRRGGASPSPRDRSSSREYNRRTPSPPPRGSNNNNANNNMSPERSASRGNNIVADAALSSYNVDMEPRETELEKTWKIIEAGSVDGGALEFSTWTKLLSCADNEKSIDGIRKAYNRFLAEYPLCYVYWKKFADHEASKGSIEGARRIYERGVVHGIPHSVDLWTFYCGFVAEKSDNLDEIRELFERGLSHVCLDYASHPLWDQYIEFELSQEEYKRVGDIYFRILSIPLEQTNNYWKRYKQFIIQQPLEVVATIEEVEEMNGYTSLDSLDKKKNWLISQREFTHKKAEEESEKRRIYENEVLKIFYFHVRPLNSTQILNWNAYLTYEEEQGDHKRIINLYERCVIPCCNYVQFWLRYVNYSESRGKKEAEASGTLSSYKAEEAQDILHRCCTKFLKKNLEMHLRLAVFLEYYGEYKKAVDIYNRIHTYVAPGHLETLLRHVALERREGNIEECERLFKEAIEDSKEESHKVLLTIRLARFLAHVSTPTSVRELFDSSLLRFPNYKTLWHAYINFEKKLGGAEVEERVNGTYERAVTGTGLYEEDRLYLLREWIEFCTEYGADPPLFRKLTTWYTDAISIGEEGMMKGLKRVLEEANGTHTPDPLAAGAHGGSSMSMMMGQVDYNSMYADPATAAAYAAYYQQYTNFDYSHYNNTAAGYASYYGGYQWPDNGQAQPQ